MLIFVDLQLFYPIFNVSESNIDIDIKGLYLHDLELQYNATKKKK